MSQSIKPDRISEGTIARMAGNIIAADVGDWFIGGAIRDRAVRAAVATARAIAVEVESTCVRRPRHRRRS